MMKNNSLKMLAESLAKNGIASLRYDKRAIGASNHSAPRLAEALAKVLGGHGRRGPACIMVLFSDLGMNAARGRVFHLVGHELVERSEEVVIDLASAYGSGMALTEAEIARYTAELEAKVVEVIARVGAQGPKDMGAVMKALLPDVQGKADGKVVSELVKQRLAGK